MKDGKKINFRIYVHGLQENNDEMLNLSYLNKTCLTTQTIEKEEEKYANSK